MVTEIKEHNGINHQSLIKLRKLESVMGSGCYLDSSRMRTHDGKSIEMDKKSICV